MTIALTSPDKADKQNMIKVKNIVKTYETGGRKNTVLKGLNFEVPTGQFLSITGKSGAGKSTTLYQMSLLDRPTSGEVVIDGMKASDLLDKERVTYRLQNFGFIFQDYAILPTLTAKENVSLPMIMQGTTFAKANKLALNALESVGLASVVDHLPSQLSGGEQQRVSIARSIVHDPKIIFADEPTANLDTESSKKILDIFLKLNRKGQTIVMVTHERDYAKLAEREIVLRDGKIISDRILKKNGANKK